MKRNLLTCLAVGTFAAVIAVAAPAYAQSDRENSTFTVTEPVDVGSFTLQPGTYLIKVVMLESNRNLVQVTNEDQTKVFASVLATPHALTVNEAAPTSRYIYYAAAPGQRKALRTWYARDTTNGQDIVYSKQRAMELAAVAKAPVIAIPDDVKETEYKTAPLTVVTPEQQVRPYQEPAPAVRIAEAPATRPATEMASPARARRLPKTASPVPLLAALGLLSLSGGLGLRILSTRMS